MSLPICIQRANKVKRVFSSAEVQELTALAAENRKTMEGTEAERAAVQSLLDEALAEQAEVAGLIAEAMPDKAKPAAAPVAAAPAEQAPQETSDAQRQQAADHAKDLGGRVVWQRGDLALVEGYSMLSGDSVYIAANGSQRTRVDIQSYTGKGYTEAQKAELMQARADAVRAADELLARNPDGPFADEPLVFANDIPEAVQGVVRGWIGLLGLDSARIVVTTPASGAAMADDLAGKFRRIGKASLSGDNTNGTMQPLGGDDFHIAVRPGVSTLKALEVLAHELGHIVERRAFAQASAGTQQAIQNAHAAWLKENSSGRALDMAQAMRAYRSGQTTGFSEDAKAMEAGAYWRSFGEWFADQVSRWATTQDKPVGVVEQFFKRLADRLRGFFTGERAKFKPDTTVAQWLDSLAKDVPPIEAASQPENDRDHFTLQRAIGNNTLEKVTFARGEYIAYQIGEGGKWAFGEIDGISQARKEFSVDGLWHPFGFAYKAERPAPVPKQGTEPLSKTVDRINAKYGAGLGPADAVSPIEAFKGVMQAVYDGKATVEDYQAGYARVRDETAMKAELGKMTKDELTRMFGIMREGKKDELVAIAYSSMLRNFAMGKEYGPSGGYMMTRNGLADYEAKKRAALDELVAGQTADDLAAFAAEQKRISEERAGKRAAMAEAIKAPKTLEDFQNFIRYHQQDGRTFSQARMMLTPEQRAAYDELVATETRGRRKVRADEQRTTVSAAGQTTAGEIIATKHTRDGHDLWVVKLSDRVSKEDYVTLLAGAKRLGGNYSSFRGNGAVPGFQFRTPDAAQAFLKLAGGDTAAATEAAKERRNAFEDDRSQSAAERLTEMADRLEERADESMGRDRKANTDRRARFAAGAEAAASADKAMAKTMRNIAGAITNGGAKFLDRVRQKVQVELLQNYVRTAKGDELRVKYQTYAEQQRNEGQPPTFETADYAEFPTFTAYRSDLASLGRQLLEVDGTKKLGERIMKVADDVSDSFTAFAKEPGNLFKLSTFSVRAGDEVRAAIFPTREGAERAITRSGLSGKAIVFAEKRGVNRIIMSPSEAMARGIWKGDGDKRITLDPDFAGELVEKIGRVSRRGAKVSVPWQFETAYDRRKQLARMGIETPAEFRAALREFIAMREQPAEPDKIKAMERAMIGRRNDGLDFFPTPEATADEMVAAADIKPGMRVLEPSAGFGHIAERIRAAGFEPDVGEFSNDRRELLEAKGFNVVSRDFMETKTRDFFTYGDTFRAPDGKVGVMRGKGGMGSDRVRLVVDGDERTAGYYNRADLEPVKRNNDPAFGLVPRADLERLEASRDFVRGDVLSSVRSALNFYDKGDLEGAALMLGRATRQAEFNPDALTAFEGLEERLRASAEGQYNRILMNPPFSDGRDIQHVRHAYDLLKPGGRLVAIMGESAFFNQNKRATEFREWLESVGGTDEKLPEGTFNDPSLPVQTGANARMVVIEKPANEQEAKFSRAPGARAGVPMADAEAVADAIRAAYPTGPQIVVLDDVGKAPEALLDQINNAQAANTVEGAYWTGKIYLFPQNVADIQRLMFVGAHHEIRHAGLDALFGKRKGALLLSIAMSNPKVAAAARAKMDAGLADSMVAATEEALADMPLEDMAKLNGWDKIVAAVRQWLRGMADKLRRNHPKLAAMIEPDQWTDNDVAALIRRAEDISRGGTVPARPGGAVFSRSAMKDADANIQRGTEAMNRAILEKSDQNRAMFRNGMGWVDFVWGDDKRGVAHILARRVQQDGMTEAEAARFATENIVETIAKGTELRRLEIGKSLRVVVEHQGTEAVLVRKAGSNTWVLTGFRVLSGDSARGATQPESTQPSPIRSRQEPGADNSESVARFSRAGTAKTTAQRQVTQAVRNTVADMLGSAGAKVSWWDKTLGTQYAKAQKFPAYKRVFDAVQQYLEDTSAMANEAADQAKGILPKLETWKDLKNFGLKPADAQAIAAPIFEGTLTDQKVYDDGELRSRFKLTPEQIAQYKEFRAAVNTSLDQAMAAEALRMLGDKNAALRELALTDRGALRSGVLQYLYQQAVKAGEDFDAQGDERGEFTKLRDDIAEKYDRVDSLKQQGYAPLMRFGQYKLNITDPATGQTLFFGLYESKAAANAALRDMQGDPEFQGADFEQGVLSQEQYKLFSAMPLDSLEMFAEAIGAEQSDVYQDFIRLAKSNRSAMKRLLKRKGTAGFSEDVPRVLAAFVTSNARMAAGALNMPTAKEAAQDIRDGDVQDEAIKLLDVVQNPTDTAGAVRSIMFVNFIGGSIASAVVNLTQPLTMTLPYLSQFGGGVKAAKRLMAAGKMAASGKVDDLALRVALKRAETDGIVSPQEIHHLTAQAMGTFGTNPYLQRAAFIWAAPFSLAEQFNRRVSFIAAFNTAREQGIEDPFGFAEKAVTETQGLYNKGNAPNLARGTIGAAALTFKQFSIHYLEWMGRMYRSGPEGKKAVALALALLILAAGTDGLPFADDLDDLIDTLGQALGYDINVKRARREFVAEQLGMGEQAADVMARGFSAVPGIPLDVSIRMSMGNLLPGTGMFLRSNTDKSRDLLEIAGPAGGLLKQYIDAGTKALKGDVSGAVQSALPVAFQNAFKGVGMWTTGEARDTLGRKVMDADEVDGLMKFIGFQPQAIARESEKIQMIRDSEQLAKNVEGEIASAWARAVVDKDPDGVADARAKLAQWNEDNPDSPIRIKMQQIITRAKKLREDRASRFITSVSPERRRAVAEALE